MRCPFCSAEDTQVKDSRPTEDKLSIRRRRFCNECDSRFTTIERIYLKDLTVVKKMVKDKALTEKKCCAQLIPRLEKGSSHLKN